MSDLRPTALVLGAGMQGVCAAFALRSRGYQVTLIDQEPAPMMRASGRNEAKIHLGLVYANDPTFRTASLVLDAALAFTPLLDRWLGAGTIDWRSLRSRPFQYAVMRDSLLSPEEVQAFYERVQRAYAERLSDGSYLGERPVRLWHEVRQDKLPAWLAKEQVAGLIETAEVALDLDAFRKRVVGALRGMEDIEALYGHRVESAERTPSGFRAGGVTLSGEPWLREADILVNSLWEGRLRLDEQLGLRPRRHWVYRLKHRLLGELPRQLAGLPSLTFALGPYGDIATYQSAPTYLNWYPACMLGWSDALTPPAEWNDACNGTIPGDVKEEIIRESLAALDRIVPGVGQARIGHVDAGVIFSWGAPYVDVGDPASELHERHDVGVHASDGYFSIDTAKFTCAPLFAGRLLEYLA